MTMLLSSAQLLKKSFELYRANLWLLVGFTAWLLLPAAGYFFVSFLPNEENVFSLLEIVISIIEIGLGLWLNIIIIKITYELLQKKVPDTTKISKEVWPLISPLVFVLILQSVLVLLGFFALVIPGVILMVWYAFSQNAVVLDQKKGMEALRFSRALSKNRFWAVLSRLLVGPIMIVLVYAIAVGVIVSVLGLMAGFSPTELLTMEKLPPWMELFISVVDIFIIPLVNMYIVMLYEKLKETLPSLHNSPPKADPPLADITP